MVLAKLYFYIWGYYTGIISGGFFCLAACSLMGTRCLVTSLACACLSQCHLIYLNQVVLFGSTGPHQCSHCRVQDMQHRGIAPDEVSWRTILSAAKFVGRSDVAELVGGWAAGMHAELASGMYHASAKHAGLVGVDPAGCLPVPAWE